LICWLVDTVGPGNHAGVTDSEAKALRDAEKLLAGGLAVSARVESAQVHAGGLWIKSGYQRDGSGWIATRADDGSVRWTPFCGIVGSVRTTARWS